MWYVHNHVLFSQLIAALEFLHLHRFRYHGINSNNVLIWNLDPITVKLSDSGITHPPSSCNVRCFKTSYIHSPFPILHSSALLIPWFLSWWIYASLHLSENRLHPSWSSCVWDGHRSCLLWRYLPSEHSGQGYPTQQAKAQHWGTALPTKQGTSSIYHGTIAWSYKSVFYLF